MDDWLVVSTHLKISQHGNLPHIGVNIKHIWNHQPDDLERTQKNPSKSSAPHHFAFRFFLEQKMRGKHLCKQKKHTPFPTRTATTTTTTTPPSTTSPVFPIHWPCKSFKSPRNSATNPETSASGHGVTIRETWKKPRIWHRKSWRYICMYIYIYIQIKQIIYLYLCTTASVVCWYNKLVSGNKSSFQGFNSVKCFCFRSQRSIFKING